MEPGGYENGLEEEVVGTVVVVMGSVLVVTGGVEVAVEVGVTMGAVDVGVVVVVGGGVETGGGGVTAGGGITGGCVAGGVLVEVHRDVPSPAKEAI